jgi:hypothetical protein
LPVPPEFAKTYATVEKPAFALAFQAHRRALRFVAARETP